MAKVTLVGASSKLWAPKILGDFHAAAEQPVDEICLNGRSRDRLEPIAALACRLAEASGRRFRITVETDLDRAARGADYVVTSIAPGGLAAMRNDIEIPERYGIFATVGDTVGPAGCSRLLRNVPVFTELARRVERASPDAWLLNLSNPLSAITRHIGEVSSLRTAGICAGITNHLWVLKDLLGFTSPPELDYTVAGIDHCSWFLKLAVGGRDLYPGLRAMSLAQLESRASLDRSKDEWTGLDSLTAGFKLFKLLGYLPAIGDRHIGEFFPCLLQGPEVLERFGMKRTGIADREAWSAAASEKLGRILSGGERPAVEKSRDIVVDIVNALAGAGPFETTINCANRGQVTDIPEGSVVETRARIDRDRIEPIPAGPLPEALRAVVLPHLLREELALRAAQRGSRELLVATLAGDPAMRDLGSAEPMADELLRANRAHLPQFSA